MVIRKKSEGEDKVKNDAKQKKCMGTKNKYKIWVYKMSTENEYNLNINQTGLSY